MPLQRRLRVHLHRPRRRLRRPGSLPDALGIQGRGCVTYLNAVSSSASERLGYPRVRRQGRDYVAYSWAELSLRY